MSYNYYPPFDRYPMLRPQWDPIAKQTEGTYEQYKKIKEFDDVGYFLITYVVRGGVVTKNATHNNVADVSDIVASIADDVVVRDGTSFNSKTPNATYFLDFTASGDFTWGTVHPEGTVNVDYIALAEVTTDANENIDTITDMADPRGGFRLKSEYGLANFAKLDASNDFSDTQLAPAWIAYQDTLPLTALVDTSANVAIRTVLTATQYQIQNVPTDNIEGGFFNDLLSIPLDGSDVIRGDGESLATVSELEKRSPDYLCLKKVIVFGDSISVGNGSFTPWTQYFSDYLDNIGGSLSNRAVGGNTIGMTTPIINGVTDLNDYDVCVVFIGTNDIGGTVVETMTDIKAMYEAFDSYTGDLYVITPMHRDAEIGAVGFQCLAQINNLLYNMFSRKWKVLNGYDMGNIPLLDGLHPTTAGSIKIFEWMTAQINKQSGAYSTSLFNYVNLPITSDNATVVLAQGIIVSLTSSEHYLSINYTASSTGLQVINLNYANCADSWLNNALYSSATGYALSQPANDPVLAVFQNVGGVRRIVFDGTSGVSYIVSVKVDIPNTQIII